MFLTELAENGLGYSSIITAKSALSNTIILADNEHVSVGEHPLVKRFLKGIYNQKPLLPRHTSVWDVSLVLNWLKSIDLNGISLKLLSWKMVMLLALLSGQRIQTLRSFAYNRKCSKVSNSNTSETKSTWLSFINSIVFSI